MTNYNIQTLKNATPELTMALEEAYKGVFSGHPWHEDRVCPNCETQYTAENKKVVNYG